MTKQFEYEEYEKLSDAVKDFENGEQIYREIDDIYTIQHNAIAQFWTSGRYAKRVEIKEKTVEAWAIIDNNEIFQVVTEPDDHRLQIAIANNLQVIKLTGTIKE